MKTENLKKYKLGEILDFFNGKQRPKNIGKYPLYGGNGIIDYVDEYNYDDNIIIGRVGANCGCVQICNEKCWVSDNAISVKVKSDFDKQYIFQLLKTLNLNTKHVGAAQPLITQNILSELIVRVPPLESQQKIAVVLSALDDKIALNRHMNAKLEQMAKRLYDHWFVQFDFPNADGKPYKASGGKMVWNEKLKREIPQGWEDCKFGDYVERITNGLNPRKNFVLGTGTNYYVTIRSLPDGEIDWNNCDKCDDEALKKINSRSQLQVGDFIFSAIGTIGRTYRIYETPSNWNISETSFTIKPKKTIPTDFFYALLKSDELQLQADRKAIRSTLRCLVMDTLCEIPCIKIDFSVTQKFSNIVRPLFLSIYKNNKEIRKLTALRNRLLPLLMNGQVEMK